MSNVFDIQRPTEPGLYESRMFPPGPRNGYLPYRVGIGLALQMEDKDGSLVGLPVTRDEAIRKMGPYRKVEEVRVVSDDEILAGLNAWNDHELYESLSSYSNYSIKRMRDAIEAVLAVRS